jgi:hypothetical protein
MIPTHTQLGFARATSISFVLIPLALFCVVLHQVGGVKGGLGWGRGAEWGVVGWVWAGGWVCVCGGAGAREEVERGQQGI